MQSAAYFFFAFVVALAAIGLALWLLRRFGGNRLGAGANRGRMPRLAVVDAAAVDGRRRLVLVRRDNIEHLIMIGGPSDIVVEPNIVRATPPQQQMPPRAPLPPAAEQAWSDNEPMRPEPLEHDEPAPLPEPPPRPARPAFAEEMRRAPAAERRSEPLAGFSPEPMVRPEPPLREPPRAMPRAEPPPLVPRPLRPEPPKPAPPVRAPERPAAAMPSAASAADKNLAEMAQRLEAALRRPGANARGESPAAVDRVGAPPVAPDAPPPRAAARPAPPETPASAETESRPSADAPKTQFKNLEDEMASLLGRPKTPS